MPEMLLLMLVAGPAVLFWNASLRAAERAADLGRQACARAGVQWLDQNVHLVRLRLRRGEHGGLQWERQYRFEYSHGGDDRQAGLVTLLGLRLSALVGPDA
jgi:hypothetical protein